MLAAYFGVLVPTFHNSESCNSGCKGHSEKCPSVSFHRLKKKGDLTKVVVCHHSGTLLTTMSVAKILGLRGQWKMIMWGTIIFYIRNDSDPSMKSFWDSLSLKKKNHTGKDLLI